MRISPSFTFSLGKSNSAVLYSKFFLSNPFVFIIIGCLLCLGCAKEESMVISLSGDWSMELDPEDIGEAERWYLKNLSDQVNLPGSLMENDKGYEITADIKWTGSIYDSSWYFDPRMEKFREDGNVKFPFWLTPNKYYVGGAWYATNSSIPNAWKEKRVVLYLERPHTETTVWINDQKVGSQNSLVAAHEYDITNYIKSGDQRITVLVDNRIKEINVGPDSHSISDHTQGNWNGIVGKIELRAMDPVWLEEIQVYPDIDKAFAKIKLTVNGFSDKATGGQVTLSAESFNSSKNHQIPPITQKINLNGKETFLEIDFPIGEGMLLWDEFDPALYRLKIELETDNGYKSIREVEFGVRDFSINGTRFEVNGRPIFLRGNVDCAAFPLTGYAPMDLDFWIDYMETIKKYGLNHVRFHSWSPPEAAFMAADRIGIYLQPEGPSWANHGTSIGDGRPVDQYIYDETERMHKAYGNYASYCMLAYGNEPAGKNQAQYLGDFVEYWIERDSRRKYTGASVGMSWPWVPESEFIVKSGPRNIPWDSQPQTLFDHTEKIKDQDVPYVAHESGQYCAYPNFDEIEKYTGVYKAKNFEIFKETLEDNHMGDQAHDFLMASGKLQALAYKHEIEAALRTPGLAGYQLLSINDFPGQGTALVGFLDAFYEEKGYLTADEFRRFHQETVPLARIPKFTYTSDEAFEANIDLYHFGKEDLKDATVEWKITRENGDTWQKGSFDPKDYPIGNILEIGIIKLSLKDIAQVNEKMNLEVGLIGTEFYNDWDFWVYPSQLPDTDYSEIYLTKNLDAKALNVLKNGGKVLMEAAGKVEYGKDVAMHFKPVFWNTSWFQMRPPHTLGILCDPKHPMFDDFATDFHSDIQWWELLHNQQVMILDNLPKEFRPIVQPIDTWFLNRRLGVIMEAKVGEGKLIISSIDLESDLEHRPAAKQLRYSILNYMNSDNFQPESELEVMAILDILEEKERKGFDFFTKSGPDELMPTNQK